MDASFLMFIRTFLHFSYVFLLPFDYLKLLIFITCDFIETQNKKESSSNTKFLSIGIIDVILKL